MDPVDQFMNLLESSLKETGRSISDSSEELRLVASNQMMKLSLVVGEPGYDRAVLAARDTVALAAGLQAVKSADAADARIIGIIQGALFFGAQTLA